MPESGYNNICQKFSWIFNLCVNFRGKDKHCFNMKFRPVSNVCINALEKRYKDFLNDLQFTRRQLT